MSINLEKYNPLLALDVYKMGHMDQINPECNKMYSYYCNRSDRYFEDHVFFGLQYYLKRYLSVPIEQWMVDEFIEVATSIVGSCSENTKTQLKKLADLGYFPVEIKSLPEGSITKKGVPLFTITNTIDGFQWVPGFLESLLLKCWYTSVVATTSYKYRKFVNEIFDKSVDLDNYTLRPFMVHDFGYRGDSSEEGAAISGVAHLCNFLGSDTVPAFKAAIKYYNADITQPIMLSVPACFPEDAEILTENCFKRFYDLDLNEKVAQYHEDGTVTFVVPNEYHEYDYNGVLEQYISNSVHTHIEQTITPNHRIVYQTANQIKIQESSTYTPVNHHNFIVSGLAHGNVQELTDEERLLIAFQADGSYSSRGNEYHGERTGYIPIRFSFKKDRKADRLSVLLDRLGYQYSKNKYDNGYYSFRVNVPKYLSLSKVFDWINLSDKNHTWCKYFIEELQFWDGSKSKEKNISYSSIEKINLDIIQAICAISGQKATIRKYQDQRTDSLRQPIYSSNIHTSTTTINIGKATKQNVEYVGKVYCVTVPTGMIITRQKDVVVISGNSEHAVACSFGKEDEFKYFENMLNLYPSGLVSIVSDQYDIYKVLSEYTVKLKDRILARNGKTVWRPDSGDQEYIICGNPNVEINSPEYLGAIRILDNIFGSSINSKGYKVLNPKIGLIYGDGIYYDKYVKIQNAIMAMGYSAENLVVGVGGILRNWSRDTLGSCLKATYVELNGIGVEIFKDPITDTKKRSAKGLLRVDNIGGDLILKDQCTKQEEAGGLLQVVFKNGVLLKDYTLAEIRKTLWN